MARKVQVILEDDLDGTEAVETVRFSLDSTSYEIDLSESNARRLRELLSEYVDAARRPGRANGHRPSSKRTPAASARSRAKGAKPDPAAVRAWARARGIAVNSRGRVSGDLVEQFRAANPN